MRQLIRDLHLEVELRVLPTVRDPDGLALSSRNDRLSTEERERSPRPSPRVGNPRPRRALARSSRDGVDVDYVEVAPFDPPVLAAAIRVGGTRLIDNVVLEEEKA